MVQDKERDRFGNKIRRLWWRELSPSQLFTGSFALAILIGTIFLATVPGLYTGPPLGWLDALFTATSAICVTGLVVVDTATWFSGAGQSVILLLIQLGGLGVVAFTTVIILALGQRISFRTQELSASHPDIVRDIDYRRLTRSIFLYTLIFESAGALILFAGFLFDMGPRQAAWHAVFHSVSAFCNAGFSTFSDSLAGYASAPYILLPVMILIVLGGMGFLSLTELHRWFRGRQLRSEVGRIRLSLHTRIVVAGTLTLLIGGWLLFTIFEWRLSLSGLSGWARLLNALFMSVTARTAGFNTVDYAQAADGSNLLTMILMTLGGAPGSTAGGIKITTVAVILLLAWSRLRGNVQTSVNGRMIPRDTVQRAVGLFVLVSIVMILSLFVLSMSETGSLSHADAPGRFIELSFEIASALNTVGLSMGETARLTALGKCVIIALMFIGRVGPLTFAAALVTRSQKRDIPMQYAEEDIVIG